MEIFPEHIQNKINEFVLLDYKKVHKKLMGKMKGFINLQIRCSIGPNLYCTRCGEYNYWELHDHDLLVDDYPINDDDDLLDNLSDDNSKCYIYHWYTVGDEYL